MLLVKPDKPEDDPYWHDKLFSKKKRRGKLKYKPKGNLYGGAEVTDQMRLGLVSKGKGDEWAHIVFPAWTFFDKIVATKPGDTPPPMDEDFPESAED
eukprot:13232915-Ditylum_brightwellii.AAC.1